MFYTIYKITNKTNGKYYIGKHQTKDLNDGYMGSGKLLRFAIKKYGIDNFTKEILHIFDNESDMNAKEKELVVISEESYNLCPGGHGGFGYINSKGFNNNNLEQKKLSNSKAKKGKPNPHMSEILKRWHREGRIPYNGFLGKKHSTETKRKMSAKKKGIIPWNKGIPRTEEEKRKIREGMKKR